jgi:hypothetical protein
MGTATAVTLTAAAKQDTQEKAAGRKAMVFSGQSMGLLAAAETYGGKSAPTNLDADAHLQAGNRMPASWMLGTRIAYEAPGTGFGEEVRFCQLVFKVPEKYRGLKDTALIMQGPDFRVEKGTGIFKGEVTEVVEDFPSAAGWYNTDPATGMPQGKTVSSSESAARRLWRVNGAYVGAVVRGFDWYVEDRRDVYAVCRPGCAFGVAQFEQAEHEPVLAQAPKPLSDLLRNAEDADAALEELSKTVPPERLAPLRRLVRAVRESQQ